MQNKSVSPVNCMQAITTAIFLPIWKLWSRRICQTHACSITNQKMESANSLGDISGAKTQIRATKFLLTSDPAWDPSKRIVIRVDQNGAIEKIK